MFQPAASASGQKIGTVSRMIEIESISVPMASQIRIISTVTPNGPSPMPSMVSWITPMMPPSARNLAYIDAVIRRNRMGAMVFPESMIASR